MITKKMKKKVYLAGSLFNEADINQRLKEGELLRLKTNIDLYNPIEAPCNDKTKLPTAYSIFKMDTDKVLESELIIADISTKDEGVMAELGIAWMCNYIHKLADKGYNLDSILKAIPKKEIIAHLSDIRKETANKYYKNYIPVGFNQYIIGMIEQDGEIYDNFNDLLESIKEHINDR